MADRIASADDFVEDPSSSSRNRNAFTELMKRKPKPEPKHKLPAPNADGPSRRTMFVGRDGLAAYAADPASFPQSRVVYYTDKFVVINDLFPKATVHLLILPRDFSRNILRPQEAFDDPAFLADCRAEEEKVRAIAASELRRRLGKYSAQEQVRLRSMDEAEPPAELPAGRNWSAEIISGTHANPSMNHLHIHVLSRDMVSECMKHRNHYLSFTTDFFIGLDQFPLSEDDHRRRYKHFSEDMHCWRCGENFHNKMTAFKQHLAEEFNEWKAE